MKRAEATGIIAALALGVFVWASVGCATGRRVADSMRSISILDLSGDQILERGTRSHAGAERLISEGVGVISGLLDFAEAGCSDGLILPAVKAEECRIVLTVRPALREARKSLEAAFASWRASGEDNRGARDQFGIALLRAWRDVLDARATIMNARELAEQNVAKAQRAVVVD